MDPQTTLLCALFFLAALLYSSVGHAGASGYLAAMVLVGLAPEVMKPTALALNVLVAAVATHQFWRAGCFDARLFWPFAVASVPCAILGGALQLPTAIYKPIVGAVLLFSAVRFATRPVATTDTLHPPSLALALPIGATIGLLSGLTGVGGGIFLTPLLLFFGYCDPRRAAGTSAPFILVNSAGGLAGLWTHAAPIPAALPLWGAIVLVGGWIGARYGSTRFAGPTLQRMLAVVLLIAGLKLMAGV
jgi:hypothetical protein